MYMVINVRQYGGLGLPYCLILFNNIIDMTLLAEYAGMMSELADMDEKFEAWDESEMNSAELTYYAEVNNRVAQKLLEVSQ